MKAIINKLLFGLLALALLSACGTRSKENNKSGEKQQKIRKEVFVPDFNADSAYRYMEEQVAFGPRVPNTPEHAACARYLVSTMKRFTPHVQVQTFKARAFDNTALNGKNIISSFNPEEKQRILLAAHWDSRPFADHDPDPEKRNDPILGANDGASGVGVLMEIARQFSMHAPDIGVDIIFFDLEDYGKPETMQANVEHDWALGSQYWSKNPHKINYRAKYGILLDMVGAEGAVFHKEGFSMYYAHFIVDKVWDIAHEIGYGNYFPMQTSGSIMDDHYYVNTIARIPMIDIIHYYSGSKSGFFREWHTTYDTMDNIDKDVLKAAGQVVLAVVYR
ncbi:MAG: M28 family peptidase, partial [Bacteroidales bacterium]|nr:M28 family peptidase [Bacteroidales bacterium]